MYVCEFLNVWVVHVCMHMHMALAARTASLPVHVCVCVFARVLYTSGLMYVCCVHVYAKTYLCLSMRVCLRV